MSINPTHVNVNMDPQWDVSPNKMVVSRSVSESISETMDRSPLGSMYEIVYAVFTQRLKSLLDPDSPVSNMIHGIIPQAVNFRALNTNVIPTAAPANSGVGSMSRMSKIWGTQPDERLPTTLPMENGSIPYNMGQNPALEANKGLLIARIFADLENHLPCVLFNVTSKTNVPMGVGGSSVVKKFLHNGLAVSQLGYTSTLTVEATVVTGGETDTANLQMIVEAAFSVLRDQVSTGAIASGKSWQLTMPTRVTPSTITETDMPWNQGDDKGGKLYIATVGLEDIRFECYQLVARNNRPQITNAPSTGGDVLSITRNGEGPTGDMNMVLGEKNQLRITGLPLNGYVTVSQTKKVVDLSFEGGRYVLSARRTGSATLLVYATPTALSLGVGAVPGGAASEPIYQREVVVSAV